MAIQNNGLNPIAAADGNLDKMIHNRLSCEFDMNQGMRGGIRIKIQFDYIYIYKREANGDASYSKCVVS